MRIDNVLYIFLIIEKYLNPKILKYIIKHKLRDIKTSRINFVLSTIKKDIKI
jgi:hypothetical protein